jgi:hypothetical protein
VPRRAERNTTDEYRSIDVRRWQRDGLLAPPRYFQWSWSRSGERIASIGVRVKAETVTLISTHSRWDFEPRALEYAVTLERTPCNYGGERVWFRCPARGCGRRVAILYSAEYFVCRHCLQLAYESQREAPHYRALHKAQVIHQRLGGTGIIDELVFKPKGMHWRTYWRQMKKLGQAESRAVPQRLLRFSSDFLEAAGSTNPA